MAAFYTVKVHLCTIRVSALLPHLYYFVQLHDYSVIVEVFFCFI